MHSSAVLPFLHPLTTTAAVCCICIILPVHCLCETSLSLSLSVFAIHLGAHPEGGWCSRGEGLCSHCDGSKAGLMWGSAGGMLTGFSHITVALRKKKGGRGEGIHQRRKSPAGGSQLRVCFPSDIPPPPPSILVSRFFPHFLPLSLHPRGPRVDVRSHSGSSLFNQAGTKALFVFCLLVFFH